MLLCCGALSACGGGSAAPRRPAPPAVSLSSVAASPAVLTLALGKTRQLGITGTYTDGSGQDVTTQADWSSSDPTKATVSAAGVVTGMAVGHAVVTAEFNGLTATTQVYVFQQNPSQAPPSTESVAYQIDPAHSGRGTAGANGPSFPPSAYWSTTLNGGVSYPLIAAGKVIVMTGANPNSSSGTDHGTSLYALDETGGAVIWGPIAIPGSYHWAAQAYDGGKVFVVNDDNVLRSFDAATGAAGWSLQLPGQYASSAPPTAVNGMVYVSGSGTGGTLYAVDESNGDVLWTAPVANGDDSSPTVSNDGVFVAYPCQVYKFDPFAGMLLWHYDRGCDGGGGNTTVFAAGQLYDRDDAYPAGRIFDAETGQQVSMFTSTAIPVISGQFAYYLHNGTLSAVDRATQNTRWTFAGDGGLHIAPIVIDSAVVIASTTGTVYALNAATGAVLWSGQAAAGISDQAVKVGLGTADGYLVVPSGDAVNAWKIVP